jgi:hypothetical protein
VPVWIYVGTFLRADELKAIRMHRGAIHQFSRIIFNSNS